MTAPGSLLPLDGVRVLDLSTSYAGPTAAMYLADLGADVVKVERPGGGDDARSWGPPFVGEASAWFYSANRNKRSIAVDLRYPDGRTVLERVLTSVDVAIANIVPSKLERLGLSPDEIRKRHPRLIYCLISGFGLDGPDAGRGGYDLVAQARSGVMSVTGAADGMPQRVSTAMSDIVTGLIAGLTVVAALHKRDRTGVGEVIDVSLLDTDLALMAPRVASYLAGEPEPRPSGGTDSVLAVYQAFATADRPIVIAIGNDVMWQRFCAVLELDDLSADSALADNAGRREARPRILPMIAERLARQPAAHWIEHLTHASVLVSPILGLSEIVTDPHVTAREAIRTYDVDDTHSIRLVASPWRFSGTARQDERHELIGQVGVDTVDVMAEHGYSPSEIEMLLRSGAVAATARPRTGS